MFQFEKSKAKRDMPDWAVSAIACTIADSVAEVAPSLVALLKDPTVPAAVQDKAAYRRAMEGVSEELERLYGEMGIRI